VKKIRRARIKLAELPARGLTKPSGIASMISTTNMIGAEIRYSNSALAEGRVGSITVA
jgi:hypothetical protein